MPSRPFSTWSPSPAPRLAGEKLIALKVRTKHGQWLPTLKKLRGGKGLPERAAQKWMSYARDLSKLQSDRQARHDWNDRNTNCNADSGSDGGLSDKEFARQIRERRRDANDSDLGDFNTEKPR